MKTTYKGSVAYRWIDKKNKRLRTASAQAAEKIRSTAQRMGLSLTKSGNISKSKKNQQLYNFSNRRSNPTSQKFKNIDRVNKAIKTWQDNPGMQEYISEKMKTFGIDPTASGRLPKGKQALADPAVDDFIRWYEQNIGTKAQFKDRIAEEYGDFERTQLDLSFFVNAYDQYSALVDKLFKQFNSSFAYSVYQYYLVDEDDTAGQIAAIKELQNILNSDLPYYADREDFYKHVQSNNPWE